MKKVMKACLPCVNRIDFLLGWDIESMGDRGRLPAGLFLWKQISSSSSATFSFIHLKAQLVLSLLVIFVEHPWCSKHNVLRLYYVSVKNFTCRLKLLSTCLIGDNRSAYFSFKLVTHVAFCQNVF